MASISIKFRPSTVVGKEGSIYFQIIHNRIVRQLNTDYRIFASEWDDSSETILLQNGQRPILNAIKERLEWDYSRLQKVVLQLENSRTRYCADDVIMMFHKQSKESSFFAFTHQVITQLQELGRIRTSETYIAALHSFKAFRQEEDIPIDSINVHLIQRYEAWLKTKGVRLNTISFYMRILRAVYNRAVEKGLTEQNRPFRRVYTGVEKTVKRAVSIQMLKALKALDLTLKPGLALTRDLFLFSFYTRGMSFVDMAYLKKKDLRNGILTYRRRKTGQKLVIKWEKCMSDIIERNKSIHPDYLLPIITTAGNERKQYKNALHTTNNHLHKLSIMIGLTRPLTMYVARHTWASVARDSNIPISVISEGMGHDSEATTQIYLASLESTVIDKANRKIIRLI